MRNTEAREVGADAQASTAGPIGDARSAGDRRIVLGAYWGLPPELARPFIESLRASGFGGRVVFVVTRYSSQDLARLGSMVDELVVVPDPSRTQVRVLARLLRVLKTTRGLRRFYARTFQVAVKLGPTETRATRWESLELGLQGLQSLRYQHYGKYLRAHVAEVDSVLIADVRDVVFQSDPLANEPPTLEVFLEDPKHTLSTVGFNRTWGEDLYGASWTALGARPVSCSGVTAGPIDEMLRYVDLMAAEIATSTIAMGPHDQAVHNWLLSNDRLGTVRAIGNGTARVLTVDQDEVPSVGSNGLILNIDGSVAPVVHQYDRHPSLAASLLSRLTHSEDQRGFETVAHIPVGVVIPAYNAAAHLVDTLNSVASQQHTNFVCVVVDDGSTDETAAIAERYCLGDDRFSLISKANAGVGAARNRGMLALLTSTRYLSFMDADDIWLDHALAKLVLAAESNGSVIGAHGLAELIDTDGQPVDQGFFSALGRNRFGCTRGWPRPWPTELPTTFETALVCSTMFPPGLMIVRSDVYERIDGFDNRMCGAEDWDALVRATRHGDIAFVDEVILHYRRHASNAGAGARVPEMCRQVRVKSFYAPENSPEQSRACRRAFRAAQVLDFRATCTDLHRAATSGKLLAFLRSGARLPFRIARYVVGAPRRRPADRELASRPNEGLAALRHVVGLSGAHWDPT